MDIDPQYYWIGIGFALVIAEVTMGNFILFFLGVAAISVGGAISVGLPVTGGWPYILFAGLSVFFLLVVRARMPQFTVGDTAHSTEDEDFLGHMATIESGFDQVSPGFGRVIYRGASWDASSEQQYIAAGTRATILDRTGNNLVVGDKES
jgi:membrane protein implicated in regulation of membrane protease activity